MSGATDSGMVKTMGFVLGALIIFAILCAVAARALSPSDEDPNDPMIRNALIERIKPAGNVRTSGLVRPATRPGLPRRHCSAMRRLGPNAVKLGWKR
jgi:hypothetical protein